MKTARLFLPLLFAFALLFMQQAGAAHALNHALEQTQQDKAAPHSAAACEQCATYAQLDSSLNTPEHHFALIATIRENIASCDIAFRTLDTIAAAARDPPTPQKIA